MLAFRVAPKTNFSGVARMQDVVLPIHPPTKSYWIFFFEYNSPLPYLQKLLNDNILNPELMAILHSLYTYV